MTYKVILSTPSLLDLDGIIQYISTTLKNPKAANSLLKDFEEILDNMGKSPRLYPVPRLKRLASRGYRRFTFGNYIAFFMIDEKKQQIYIVRILYQKQDYGNLL